MTTTTLTRSASTGRLTNAFTWTLQLATAAMFLFSGSLKVAGVPMMVQMFGLIGLGQWFRYFTGAVELASAVLLLVPSLAFFGGLSLATTMVGAILTHLLIVGGSPAVPIALLASTTWIAWVRRED